MTVLREKIEKLRSLPVRKATGSNWVLHYLSAHGHMPEGWEMVWGNPVYTGRKRSKLRTLPTAVNWPTIKITEGATLSANVNPDVRDVNPVPVPKTGGTSLKTGRAFRANLTSGDRTKHQHESPHRDCPVYSPECRDQEWETPTWIGGTDWTTRPLFRHQPPDAREVFAQDPSGRIPADVPLPHGPPGFIPPNKQIDDSPSAARNADIDAAAFSDVVDEGIGYKMSDPVGLMDKTKSSVKKLRQAWIRLSGSGESAVDQATKFFRQPKKKSGTRRPAVKKPSVFDLKHKPGTPEHDAALYKTAIEIRRQIGKTMYIVDYNRRRYTTSNPQRHAKIIHVVEATTSASFPTQTTTGLTFYGRRGLATIEKERQSRMTRQSASKCKGYDPKCRDKDWEVPTGGAGLLLSKRSSIIS